MFEPIIIELSNYVKPTIKESNSTDWVLNGDNNSFYDYLIERFNGSTTHSAIINKKIELMYGKGITLSNAHLYPSDLVKLINLFPKRELRKIISDFELFGSASFQIVKNKKGEPLNCYHIPRQTLAPKKMNDKGEIEAYFYCKDWAKVRTIGAEEYPTFGYGTKTSTDVYVIEPYRAGKFYFADPKYLACLQYAQLEEEISNYSVNHIRNGLSAGYIINFNQGVPTEEQAKQVERDVKRKLTSSGNAGNVIISFNDNKENAPTIEVIPTNTSHEAWQFWVTEARTNIMVGHGVTSPILFGIKDNTGFGNNADELETAFQLYMNTELKPNQEILLDAFMDVAQFAGVAQEIEFKQMILVSNDMREDTQLSAEKKNLVANDTEVANALIELGEDEDENYDLIFSHEVDEDDNLELNLAKVITGFPNDKSEQDTEVFKVRYSYAPNIVKENSREFCRKMVNAGKIYRKEDIIFAGDKKVNKGWGLNGADNYSIWKYKGGGACHHFWERRIYLRRNNKKITVTQARKMLMEMDVDKRKNARWVENEKDVAKLPIDMPNKGFVNKKM